MHHCNPAHRAVVEERLAAEWCVDDQLNLVVEDLVTDVRPSLVDLEHDFRVQPVRAEIARGSARRDEPEAQVPQVAGNLHDRWLVVIVDADEGGAFERELHAGANLRLREGGAERRRSAHHLSRGLHLGTEDRIDAGETNEWKHRRLHKEAGYFEIVLEAELLEGTADHYSRGHLRERHARRLRQERHGPRRARIHLEHINHVVLDRELRVHQADDLQGARDAAGIVTNQRHMPIDHLMWRDDAGTVSRVDARLLDMFHDAADDHRAG